jgi:hypothetical protein
MIDSGNCMSNTLRKPKNPYGSSPRKLLEDKNISLKAKGIYAFMECKIDGWNFTASSMASQLKESRKTILVAMQELKANGWLTYHKNRDGSGVYVLIGNYVTSPQPENDTMLLQSHSPKSTRCKNDTVPKTDCINKKDYSNKNNLSNKNNKHIQRQLNEIENFKPNATSLERLKMVDGCESLNDKELELLVSDFKDRMKERKSDWKDIQAQFRSYVTQGWIKPKKLKKGTVTGKSSINKKRLLMQIEQEKQWRLE